MREHFLHFKGEFLGALAASNTILVTTSSALPAWYILAVTTRAPNTSVSVLIVRADESFTAPSLWASSMYTTESGLTVAGYFTLKLTESPDL
jgi:hypothetical protein